MKKLIKYLAIGLGIILLGLIIYSVLETSDNFYDCTRTFKLDKQTYYPGDTIRLTVEIIPEKEEKEVRIYKNFKNLDFSLVFHRLCYPDKPENGLCAYSTMIKEQIKEKNEDSIKTYLISKEKPFNHEFYGLISYDSIVDKLTIEFADYGYKCEFEGIEYDKSVEFGFTGIWYPIKPESGASLEEFIKFEKIEIKRK